MEPILDHIVNHFQEYLIIGLIGVLFFRESVMAFINAKLGIKDTPAWAERLIQYTNHDTTERLEQLIEMEQAEHNSQKETRDTLIEISHTLKEIKEYGVKVRRK